MHHDLRSCILHPYHICDLLKILWSIHCRYSSLHSYLSESTPLFICLLYTPIPHHSASLHQLGYFENRLHLTLSNMNGLPFLPAAMCFSFSRSFGICDTIPCIGISSNIDDITPRDADIIILKWEGLAPDIVFLTSSSRGSMKLVLSRKSPIHIVCHL